MEKQLAAVTEALADFPDHPGLVHKFIELTLDLDVASDVKISKVISMLHQCALRQAQLATDFNLPLAS